MQAELIGKSLFKSQRLTDQEVSTPGHKSPLMGALFLTGPSSQPALSSAMFFLLVLVIFCVVMSSALSESP